MRNLKMRNSDSAFLVTPIYPLRPTLYLYFEICLICLLNIHKNNNKFTYAKFGFSVLDYPYISAESKSLRVI